MQMSYRRLARVMAVTLDGAFHCVQACLPALKKNGAGTIVNIGGMSAHTGSKHRAHVMTAKAGLIGFTRALAHDLAADNITVNCVVAGPDRATTRPRASPEPAASSDQPHHHRRATARPTTSPRWCGSSAAPAAATSPGRPSMSMAGRS